MKANGRRFEGRRKVVENAKGCRFKECEGSPGSQMVANSKECEGSPGSRMVKNTYIGKYVKIFFSNWIGITVD